MSAAFRKRLESLPDGETCGLVRATPACPIAEHLIALNRAGITICLIEHDMALIRELFDLEAKEVAAGPAAGETAHEPADEPPPDEAGTSGHERAPLRHGPGAYPCEPYPRIESR